VVEDALTKSLCGICSKETPAALVASLGVCSTVGGLWTEATWTAGIWGEPPAGWAGDSYTHSTQYASTNVHTITIADGYGCYDKVHEDGQPTCNGSTAGNSSCQTAFEDRRTSTQCPAGCTFYPRNGSHGPYCDGLALDGETSCIEGFETTDVFSEESCLAIDSQCVYVPAIQWTRPPADIHAPPADLGPGWQEVIKADETTGDCTGRSNLPQCEGKDNIAGFQYGVCRLATAGALNGENVNQKYCKTCINTNGDQVNLNEKACAQACLDDPSGSCMGFSHADNANCILYGVNGEQYLRHPGDLETEWLGYALHDEPCLADKIPIGCTPGFNTIKMNTKFVCRHLTQDNTRWLAWGEATGSEEITVELTIIPSLSDPVGVEDFTQEMIDELRIKMASVALVDADKDVSLEIGEGDQDGHVKVTFTIQVPSNVIIPMTGMLSTILVSKSRDGTLYFHSKVTTDNSLKNEGTLIPKAGHIAGILVKGMRHNLIDKSKELSITSWSELSSSACSVDPVDGAGGDGDGGDGDGGIPGLCFSGRSVVKLEDGTTIQMSNLKIGDRVQVTVDGKFDTVYSFGHYQPDSVSEYLSIQSTANKAAPITISAPHMLFLDSRKAVPASSIKVGDVLLGENTVTKVDKVSLLGAYAPFTYSGSIVVNDVVASNYVSLTGTSTFLGMDMQLIAHTAVGVRRALWCHLSSSVLCGEETYSDEGVATWIPFQTAAWIASQEASIVFFFFWTIAAVVGAITTTLLFARRHPPQKVVL